MKAACACLLSVCALLATLVPAGATLSYLPKRTSDGLAFLVVEGAFAFSDSADEFERQARAIGAGAVVFHSPGGNVYAAMAIGRRIRALGLNTLQFRQTECASACSLAFLGGVMRMAEPGSIGVHRTSFVADADIARDDAVAGVQALTADILAYLKEMGVSADLLEIALRYDAGDMRYLSASEMQALGVVTGNAGAGPSAALPAPAAPQPTEPPAAPAPQTAESERSVEQDAVALVRTLVESDSGASLDAVRRWYADEVAYYGETLRLSDVMADKRRYFERWPQRHYRIRPETLDVKCFDSVCRVSGEYDWEVRSPARNRKASGGARFLYTISLGPSPKVTAEAGYVMK